MKFFAIFYAFILVNICHCGDDDGKDGTPPGASGHGEFVAGDTLTFLMPVTLDLSAKETEHILKQTIYIGRTEISHYTMRAGVPIVQVVDGDNTVWVGSVDCPCKSAKLVSRGSDYKSLVLFVGSGYNAEYKYFEMVENTWRELSEEEKGELLGKKEVSIPPEGAKTKDSSFVLDIENVNDPRIKMDTITRNRVVIKSYKDMEGSRMVSGSRITSVVSGAFVFWEKGEFEVLRRCEEYLKGRRRLVYIRVNSLGLTKKFCFQKFEDGWERIEKDEFKRALIYMKMEGDREERDEEDLVGRMKRL
ncbi:signal peptide containing protein [Theileria equi strain WA]|uniref:Signal peptide containing protein n=1 Tax=Theileria equi strain WA TaxID=1537102 RepID=L1LCP0_THEEQ|nr:signal peptide containing protein [Theileria equi strain WA]EKX73015.1 signal peptide containing protein [Theileria equi strain WA]|eukprot:XP_004832467.1 signal peptide containing protein [Theileria equi strain WA]